MEEVVGHVFHHAVDLGARHLALPRVGVRQRGVAIDVLERDRLPGEDGDAPAKARRERDLGVGTLEERVEDDFVEGPVEVAATIEQRLRDGQALTELRLVRPAHLADQLRHRGIFGQESREHRDEAIARRRDPSASHVEIEATQELSV